MSINVSIATANRKAGITAGAVLAVLLSASSAQAQVQTPTIPANCTQTQTGTFIVNNIQQLAIPAGASGAAIAGAIGSVNSVFLTQQGSAFVSAPSNPTPNQPGGGVWARGVGGEADVKSTSISNGATVTAPGSSAVTVNCANSTHENFAGVQIGADIARLNWNGWNVHLGTTAGYLGSKENDNNGFNNTVQVPFIGTYLVATHGRFFADLMVREDYFNINLNNPGFNFNNQPVGAHGFSISTSAGYNFDAGQGWFIEPSGGFIYSKTSVDNFVVAGAPSLSIQGLVSTNDIESELGRLSLRVGKTIDTPNVIWQPFFTASVFHEFAGNVISNFSALQNGLFVAGAPATYNQVTSTSRIGTYGQYSLGVAAQVANTGWLGYARVDYRNGDNINGWTGNAGIRYQFTPEMIASVMPVKVKAPHAYIAPTNWTGFYVGGFGGAAAGRTDIGFVGDPTSGNRPYTFGGLGGLEAGYNYQFPSRWVIGIEGDIAATNLHGGRPAGSATGVDATGVSTGAFTPAFFTVNDKTNWMGTVTGRLGYSWDRTLFYGKAGVAFEDSSTSVNCIFGPTGQVPLLINGVPNGQFRSCFNQAGVVTGAFSTPNYTRVGYTLGFGTEFDLGRNWSAKTEYDFLSFGSHTARANDGTTFMTDKAWVSQVKVGVNYKFTPGALVAKY
jgi:opacity protein-like surface antigen